MRQIPEQVIQQECYNYFVNNYCLKHHQTRLLIHSVPNGIPVHLPPGEMARALSLLKKTGMVTGVSDLIIHGKNGRCLHAECKTEKGHQSDAQLEIQRRIQDLGGVYFVFRSLSEFKEKISKHIDWLLGK